MSFQEKFMSFLDEKLVPVAGAIANQRHLKAMRDGLMYTIPLTVMGGLFLIVSNPPIDKKVVATNFFMQMMVAWRDWAAANSAAILLPYRFTMALMGLFVAMNVAYSLAKHYKMDMLPSAIISTVTFLLVAAPLNKDNAIPITYLDAKGIFTAVIVALVTVEVTRFLKAKNITIKMPEGVPPAVSSSFDALVPLLVNIGIFYSISLFIQSATKMIVPQAMMKALAPAISAVDSIPAIILVTILAQLFWFAGIHGAAIIKTGVIQPFLDANLAANSEAMINGQPLTHIFTNPFWAYFIVLGGSGATLGLTFFYLRSRSKQLKTLGRVALGPALFNINEPIIFGTPMVLNPLMFIPFVFVEAINGVLAFVLTKSGVIKATFVNVPWTTPAPLGAFLATLDWKAVVLVFAILGLDMLLYYPFFKIYEKELIKNEQLEEAQIAAGSSIEG